MWQPVSRREFEELYETQRRQLSAELRDVFDRFAVPVTTAIIRRTEVAGDEFVFVVAKTPRGVLYYDDVEIGFEFSPVDRDGRITGPVCSQSMLADAVRTWLVESVGSE